MKIKQEKPHLATNNQANIDANFVLDDKSNILFEKDITNLKSWLIKPGFTKIKLSLLYRGSRDGFSGNSFHEKCDNKTPTISFIRSNYNLTFGGFTNATWNYVNGGCKSDHGAFIFSLTHEEKMLCNKPEHAIFSDGGYLVVYGAGNDIAIWENNKSPSRTYFPTSYSSPKFSGPTEASKSYLAGSYNFTVVEIELYHVIWQ